MPGRKKVIRGLELCSQQRGGPELCEQCPYNNEPFPCGNALLQDVLSLLKEQEARWIPVTERLPEEWHIVITYQPSPSWMEDRIGLRRTAVYIGNGKWREAEKHNMMELPVTHWMPLPEPPKEEDKE